jgi:hypothetical protein
MDHNKPSSLVELECSEVYRHLLVWLSMYNYQHARFCSNL